METETEKRYYLPEGTKVFCTGAFLITTKTDSLNCYSVEDDMYYNGLPVQWDENGYYIEQLEL